jgi:glycosyltransferase involved in cell wall biosynthesis
MNLGVARPPEDTNSFFPEILADFQAHHQVQQFTERTINSPAFHTRLNRRLYRRDWQAFLQAHDVVFFEWASRYLVDATQLPKTCGIVTRLHRFEMYEWAERVNWDVVDKIILVSQAKQREFNRRFPGHEAKTVVIPEGTSLARFQVEKRPFNGDIGTLCHLRPRKRVYELILAFAELARVRGDVQLHIAGGEAPLLGDYLEAMHSAVQKLKLQERVTFYGKTSNPEKWYRHIDIFVSNSYSEGLQLAPMEAIASGNYALVHDWDGADELLPPDYLYLTDNELNARISHFCDLPEAERQQHRDRQLAIVHEKFDINQIKTQIRQVVEEVGQRYQ